MCRRLGFEVKLLETPWGEGAPVERYLRLAERRQAAPIKAVLVCQNETATGVTSDVAAIRRAMDGVKHPALLFVDSVSALASIDFRMDEWGVDVCVSGSQKGLMLPAGLGVTCVSQKALEPPSARFAALLFRLRRHGGRQRLRLFSRTPRRCRCCTDCANRSPCSPRKAWRTCSGDTAISPAACAPRCSRAGN